MSNFGFRPQPRALHPRHSPAAESSFASSPRETPPPLAVIALQQLRPPPPATVASMVGKRRPRSLLGLLLGLLTLVFLFSLSRPAADLDISSSSSGHGGQHHHPQKPQQPQQQQASLGSRAALQLRAEASHNRQPHMVHLKQQPSPEPQQQQHLVLRPQPPAASAADPAAGDAGADAAAVPTGAPGDRQPTHQSLLLPGVEPLRIGEPFLNPVWRTEHTQEVQLLVDSRRLRVELHRARFEDGLEVRDWLWLDTPDIVNVIPRTSDGLYWTMRERRYGLRQRCMGTVGGHVGPGEPPLLAAQRELMEELQMEAPRWRFLGSFRTDANRGAGVSYFFLAEDAEFVDPEVRGPREQAGLLAALEGNNDVPGDSRAGEIPPPTPPPVTQTEEEDPYGADIEAKQPVLLSQTQLLQRLLDNSFQEVKWSGAAALAMLRVLADQHFPGLTGDLPLAAGAEPAGSPHVNPESQYPERPLW